MKIKMNFLSTKLSKTIVILLFLICFLLNFTCKKSQAQNSRIVFDPPLDSIICKDNINIRKKPSIKSEIINKLKYGEHFSVLQKTAFTDDYTNWGGLYKYYWFQIQNSELTGWVRADLIAVNEKIISASNRKDVELWVTHTKAGWCEAAGIEQAHRYWLRIYRNNKKIVFLADSHCDWTKVEKYWSPDGNFIIINYKIFKADGSVYYNSLPNTNLTWSNDSKYLYFRNDINGMATDLCRLNLAKLAVENVVENPLPISQVDKDYWDRSKPKPIKWLEGGKYIKASYRRIKDEILLEYNLTLDINGNIIKKEINYPYMNKTDADHNDSKKKGKNTVQLDGDFVDISKADQFGIVNIEPEKEGFGTKKYIVISSDGNHFIKVIQEESNEECNQTIIYYNKGGDVKFIKDLSLIKELEGSPGIPRCASKIKILREGKFVLIHVNCFAECNALLILDKKGNVVFVEKGVRNNDFNISPNNKYVLFEVKDGEREIIYKYDPVSLKKEKIYNSIDTLNFKAFSDDGSCYVFAGWLPAPGKNARWSHTRNMAILSFRDDKLKWSKQMDFSPRFILSKTGKFLIMTQYSNTITSSPTFHEILNSSTGFYDVYDNITGELLKESELSSDETTATEYKEELVQQGGEN